MEVRAILTREDMPAFERKVDTAMRELREAMSRPRKGRAAQSRPVVAMPRFTAMATAAAATAPMPITAPITPVIPLDPKVQAELEWDATPSVRTGFSSKASYIAYREAEARGLCTRHGFGAVQSFTAADVAR